MPEKSAERLQWIRQALDTYEGPLVRYARRILGDEDQARDVAQETFLQLCRQRREHVDGHLAQWLYTVCRNRALAIKRKERRMTTLSQSTQRQLASGAPTPEAAAETSDSAGQVSAELDRLPENQQEVIRLKFESGLSYKQIAEVTGHTVSNVGFLLHRGLKTLRQRLAEAGS